MAQDGDDRVTTALNARLRDPSARVRLAALGVLTRVAIPCDACTTGVSALVTDRNAHIRQAAIGALGCIAGHGGEEAFAGLVGHMQCWRDTPDDVRVFAIQALSKVASLGDKDVINALLQRLGDHSIKVTCAAIKAVSAVAET